MSWMDEAMKDLRPWIGQVRAVEDDVGLMAVRRAAGAFDLDPEKFSRGTELPPHWFTCSSAETVRQSDIGPDGHAKKGVVLPPIPMPRRMGAGRRVKIMGRLRAGEPAVKKAEVADIVPKSGRSGDIFVLTMRHTIRAGAARSSRSTSSTRSTGRRCRRPEDHGDRADPGARPTTPGARRTELTNTLNFRYLRADLERPPHPLRRRLHAQRGRLSGPRVQRRPVHAPDGRCRAAATPRAR